ncbi:hypothetical protein EB796_005877 [Bugula neritina]|uniref:Uncharacterized protein n=1 Tax=Bugula neritina TaxID=10212 RepID=A0A7J7KAY5_BUGNE|nr:hypothetical protein EB796_005877 [Bugula neritina]
MERVVKIVLCVTVALGMVSSQQQLKLCNERSQTQPNVTWTQRVAANLKCCLTVSDTASCAMTPMKSSRSIVFLPSQNLVKTRTSTLFSPTSLLFYRRHG